MRISDWSSDVCSSDLQRNATAGAGKMHGSRSPEHDGKQPVILNLECSPGDSPAAIAMRWHVPRIGHGVRADEAADCARTPAYPTSGPPRACGDALNGAAATPRSDEHTTEVQTLMRP